MCVCVCVGEQPQELKSCVVIGCREELPGAVTENLADQWMQHFPFINQIEVVPLQSTRDVITVGAEAQVACQHCR